MCGEAKRRIQKWAVVLMLGLSVVLPHSSAKICDLPALSGFNFTIKKGGTKESASPKYVFSSILCRE
jgi:hypothetical protein